MRRVPLIIPLLVLGCAPKPTQPIVVPDRQDPCRLIAGSAHLLDTLTVPLFDPVDREHALSPVNDSELLLYRMTLDTPLRLDCRGQPVPGLATFWERDSTGQVWTLTLKDGARLYTSALLTAHDVVAAWNERKAIERSMTLQSAVALDDRRISVRLSRPQDSVPKILADPAFSFAIDPSQRPPQVKFELQAGIDPRDVLDRGADLVVTRDPTLVDYVSNRPEFAALPLPWSRTYVLLETGIQQGDLAGTLEAASVRSSLAKDAVQAGARAAEPPYWWSHDTACRASSTPHSSTASSRVVYRKDDEVARGLAERIVAVGPASAALRAVGLDAAEFASAVRGGTERAYVVGLARQSLAPCRDASIWPSGARLLPLIETRAYAIVRKGTPPLTVDWDGTVRVVQP